MARHSKLSCQLRLSPRTALAWDEPSEPQHSGGRAFSVWSNSTACLANIRLWHKADILIIGENFRFRGQSGH
jgi:hypothetical protein